MLSVKPSRYNFDEKDDDEQVENNQESSSDESETVSQSETTEPLPENTEHIEIETSECEHVEI